MKIALIHYAAQPVVGGVESVIGHQARLMTENGHQVCIVAGRGDQMDARIPFVRLPLADSRHEQVLHLKSDLDAGRVPKEFDSFVERLESQLLEAVRDADWLIAHNVCSLNKNLALTAALKRLSETHARPRLILWHHDLAWVTPRYQNELHDGYPWNLLRTDWPRAAQVTVSETRRRELSELLKVDFGRILVVPNGIDAAQFLKLESQTERLIGQLDMFSAAPLILLPVRITPRKNIELALRVLAELHLKFKRARLVVTGPLGPHNPANAEYFERLVALRRELNLGGAVHFLAELGSQALPDEVIADLYRMADVLFLPSREEGFGIPILEGGLRGIPIFCADIPPLRELGGSQANYFSPDADPQKVAAQLSAWLEASPIFTLRERIRDEFTWGQVYARHIEPLLA
ncbi:MAG TPA: glycosyltransferase, partial [Anaerolineales bacterium]|nr:glycosyltransferase [Anaerolineales bacterium]